MPGRGRVGGSVVDHELVKSGTYDPASFSKMEQGPSFSERVNQALIQSVGEARPRHRVPKEFLAAGGAMVAAGVLLSTIWSHVTVVDDLAVSVTPTGGVLASRSFGW